MVVITKEKRQLVSISANVRAITLSAIVTKLFDAVTLSKKQNAKPTSYFQFSNNQIRESGASGTKTTHFKIADWVLNRSKVFYPKGSIIRA